MQELLKRVKVRPQNLVEKAASPLHSYDQRYPEEFPCHITIRLKDGRELESEKCDFEGFFSRPMAWDRLVSKFDRLSSRFADSYLRRDIVQAVSGLEGIRVSDLTALLAKVDSTVGEKRAAS